MYPCQVPAAQMRTKPVGTGPFKLVSFKQNEGIKIERNADYWKKGKPYLDGIDFTIVPNRGTAS
jgi:peptide/nickel transport system substrate-binding protein